MTNRANSKCECGSTCYTKGGYEGISPLVWECNNCEAETPRVEFKGRTTGEYTPTQKMAIARLEETFSDVKVQRHYGSSLWVTFTNGEKHFFSQESFGASISICGYIQIKSASSMLFGLKREQGVIARLACYKIGGKATVRLM